MDLAIIKGSEVRNAVVEKLRAISPETTPIYAEQIFQEFREPCFFVYETSMREEHGITPYFWQFHKVEVKYYPDPDSSTFYEDCLNMSEKIRRTLDCIALNATAVSEKLSVRAISPESQLFDEYCVYYATYRIKCLIKPKTEPAKMQHLNVNT